MNLYWDLQDQKLVYGLTNSRKVERVTYVLRDFVPVSLYLLETQANVNQPYTVRAITSGHAIKFGAKAALTDETYLSELATWTETGSGQGLYYAGSIPLNSAALIAAMVGVLELDLIAELTTQDGDGKHYLSTQFTLRVKPDVITGGEA